MLQQTCSLWTCALIPGVFSLSCLTCHVENAGLSKKDTASVRSTAVCSASAGVSKNSQRTNLEDLCYVWTVLTLFPVLLAGEWAESAWLEIALHPGQGLPCSPFRCTELSALTRWEQGQVTQRVQASKKSLLAEPSFLKETGSATNAK